MTHLYSVRFAGGRRELAPGDTLNVHIDGTLGPIDVTFPERKHPFTVDGVMIFGVGKGTHDLTNGKLGFDRIVYVLFRDKSYTPPPRMEWELYTPPDDYPEYEEYPEEKECCRCCCCCRD